MQFIKYLTLKNHIENYWCYFILLIQDITNHQFVDSGHVYVVLEAYLTAFEVVVPRLSAPGRNDKIILIQLTDLANNI